MRRRSWILLIVVGLGGLAETRPILLSYLGTTGGSKQCLEVEKLEHQGCTNTKGWFDGTNGCEAYEKQEEQGQQWCTLYGQMEFLQGSAQKNCCVCGGGNGTVREWRVKDEVSVRLGNTWVLGIIQTVKPKAGIAYEVSLPNTYIGGGRRKRMAVRKETTVRPRSDQPPSMLKLKTCNLRKPAQRWLYDGNLTGPDGLALGSAPSSEAKLETAEILGLPDIVHIKVGATCLAAGKFGEPTWANPKFVGCVDSYYKDMPFIMWETVDAKEPDEDQDDYDRVLDLVRGGVSEMAPWDVLGVDRTATTKEVKAAFRDLSRVLHPDKRRKLAQLIEMPFHEVTEIADAIFTAAQNAYDGLKNDDDRARNIFRQQHEKDEKLFGPSANVLELSPNDFPDGVFFPRRKKNDVWVIMLYSSSCSMSRAMAPLVNLAAKVSDVPFGAYPCGGHGAAAAERKRRGFAAVFDDKICAMLEPGFSETPRFVAISGDVPSFRFFYDSVRAPEFSTKLLDFSRKAHRLFHLHSLVDTVDTDEALDAALDDNDGLKVVVYVRLSSTIDANLNQGVATFVPSLVLKLKDAGARLIVADCGKFHCDPIDFLPAVHLYPDLGGGPIPLLDEAFTDLRDAQVALTALANTLAATKPSTSLSTSDDDDLFKENSEEEQEEAPECQTSPQHSPPLYDGLPNTWQDPAGELPEGQGPPTPRPVEGRLEPRAQTPQRGGGGGGIIYGGNSFGSGGAIGH